MTEGASTVRFEFDPILNLEKWFENIYMFAEGPQNFKGQNLKVAVLKLAPSAGQLKQIKKKLEIIKTW